MSWWWWVRAADLVANASSARPSPSSGSSIPLGRMPSYRTEHHRILRWRAASEDRRHDLTVTVTP